MVALTLENVTISYNRHPAIHHVSGRFKTGSLTALTGPNGGGKSTLVKAIAGALTPDEGQITIERQPQETIAYLPQSAELQRDFPMSVMHLVTSGTWQKTGAFGTITSAMKQDASKALEEVGLRGFESRDLSSLSSGQFQRALFARLLMQDASLILLDEPFTAIDQNTTNHLLEIVMRWHQEKRTVICVLHDFEQIRTYFPECLLLARECIAWGPTQDTLTTETLLRTQFFRTAWNGAEEICRQAS